MQIKNLKRRKRRSLKPRRLIKPLGNESKPIWTRKPEEIEQGEYDEFYKSITKDKSGPMTQTHFIAEGGVDFKSLLFVPNSQPSARFNIYGQAAENIKLYVRRVFSTDDFKNSYPGFVKGVADSDDLPLNVSRETLLSNLLRENAKVEII